jgi:hypothetical protein
LKEVEGTAAEDLDLVQTIVAAEFVIETHTGCSAIRLQTWKKEVVAGQYLELVLRSAVTAEGFRYLKNTTMITIEF